jgi:folate-binding protein YgfZ
MADSTITMRVQDAGARLMPWGDSGADGTAPPSVAEDFGAFAAEYAAIRRRVGIFYMPHRGLLRLTGDDVLPFLQALTTQQLEGRAGGWSGRSLLLSANGHVIADLFIHHGDACTWLELDRSDVPTVRWLLDNRLFGEDVQIDDGSDGRAWLWLLGPATAPLLETAYPDDEVAARVMATPGTHHVLDAPNHHITAARRDLGDAPGCVLAIPQDHAADAYDRLLDAAGFAFGSPHASAGAAAVVEVEQAAADAARRRDSLRGRPVGWAAVNTVRVEQGVPRFHIDFGPDCLPAEAGPALLDEAVSLTKGCYPGQEAVARMHNLGHPKRIAAAWASEGRGGADGSPGSRSDPAMEDATPPVPPAGSPVLIADPAKRATAPRDGQIGAVTSAVASPLAGQQPVGLAMMRWGKHKLGTVAVIDSPSGQLPVALK